MKRKTLAILLTALLLALLTACGGTDGDAVTTRNLSATTAEQGTGIPGEGGQTTTSAEPGTGTTAEITTVPSVPGTKEDPIELEDIPD